MFRILIVEDNAYLYQDYILRLFTELLPMEKISMVHVPTLQAACQVLQEPWDCILMDYFMGAKYNFMGGITIRDGADLTKFRRALEETKGIPESYILGTSSSEVGNEFIRESGANSSILKLKVAGMAKLIEGLL